MNLLIVDDEIYIIQGLLADIDKAITGLDTIYTANCYSQAMNIFMEHPIDILLCDIEMPFGSGLDLVERVKKNYEQTECIFLTCHDQFSFAQQAVKLSCLDYIIKPVEAEQINDTLCNAVKHIHEKRKEDIYKEYGRIYMKNMFEEHTIPEKDENGIVEKVENYVLEHIQDMLVVEELARRYYVSVNHLNRLFKKRFNMTVGEYITDVRMKTAARLLETTQLSVVAVSDKTGYNNYSYFIKVFKKYYGMTPKEYMKINRNNRG